MTAARSLDPGALAPAAPAPELPGLLVRARRARSALGLADDQNPVLQALRLALDVEMGLYERALRTPAEDPAAREVRRRCRVRLAMVLNALRREQQQLAAQQL
ncbi:MAG TPA: hypothetical protein VKZ49_03320 [Polyangiaceae bacterium]|nr:hypothetical protein [Polyangiaceae bacterium]